jgi:hypothetical protein
MAITHNYLFMFFLNKYNSLYLNFNIIYSNFIVDYS